MYSWGKQNQLNNHPEKNWAKTYLRKELGSGERDEGAAEIIVKRLERPLLEYVGKGAIAKEARLTGSERKFKTAVSSKQ